MATTIKLYKTNKLSPTYKWHLVANRLIKVDDFNQWIALYPSSYITTISNFQYVKHGLEISINVDLSQSYSQITSDYGFKYVSIQNDSDRVTYYFVKKVNWRSKSCVNFELVMDVLNTFEEGNDYVFKPNTKITREHKDRYVVKGEIILFTYAGYLGGAGTISADDNIYFCTAQDPTHRYLGTLVQVSANPNFFKVSFPYTTNTSDLESWINSQQEFTIIYVAKDTSNYVALSQIQIDERDPELYRNIDDTPENINPVLICDNTIAEIIKHPKSILRGDWYLLYRNQNDPSDSLVNPVECYLFADTEKHVNSGVITSGKLTPSSLVDGKYYYARIQEKDSGGTELIAQSITTSAGVTISKDTLGGGTVYGIYVEITKNRNNTMNVSVFRYLTGDSQVHYVASYFDLDYIQLNNLPFYYVLSNSQINYINLYRNAIWNSESTWTNTGAYNIINELSLLDRTDAKNIKLIKLPYCPYDFTISGTTINVSSDPNWDYTYFEQANHINFYALKLHYLDTKLEGTLETDSALNPYEDLYMGSKSTLSPQKTESRRTGLYYESKLYNSEFYQPTFYYDSFAFKFELESLDINSYVNQYNKTEIKFNMTSTINSKFMFTFNNYECMRGHQNYSKYLPIARNNEEVLYNVPYINYIRTGYGYDVKNKNISNISNALGVGLSAGSLAVSLAVPSAPLKVAGVVASVVSMAMSVKNAIVTAVQNDNSLKQKITQYQNQSTSVAGSDDVDLMSVYAENKLKYMKYEPRQNMEKLLFDLFFYAGYSSNRMGFPKHNTRVNFDYLECDACIEAIAGGISQECLDELINCYKNGVTYIHRNTARSGANQWDFEQKYENWETWLFN